MSGRVEEWKSGRIQFLQGSKAGTMGRVVALLDDLIFQAKLAETARQAGVELKTVASGEGLAAEAASGLSLVIVDLNARCGALEAIAGLRGAGNDTRVVAFVSHVQTEVAERARAAGCDEVMPRSKFTRELATLLAQAKSE